MYNKSFYLESIKMLLENLHEENKISEWLSLFGLIGKSEKDYEEIKKSLEDRPYFEKLEMKFGLSNSNLYISICQYTILTYGEKNFRNCFLIEQNEIDTTVFIF
jgi:hypothetical protein